jgi:hypothetical protein
VEYRNFEASGRLLSTMPGSESTSTEAGMLHDQVITSLEATIMFLLLTNALSVAAAAYAITVASGRNALGREAKAVAASRVHPVLTAIWPRSGR